MMVGFCISDSHIVENISNLREGDNVNTVEFQGKRSTYGHSATRCPS